MASSFRVARFTGVSFARRPGLAAIAALLQPRDRLDRPQQRTAPVGLVAMQPVALGTVIEGELVLLVPLVLVVGLIGLGLELGDQFAQPGASPRR